ncbi:hypothetical protein CPBF367_36660 [Xanthomonas arboricola pv. juglandis]|nr:hypothetical protein CPBF367_36660 [Xanthomonas arboricola pv. juglandis]
MDKARDRRSDQDYTAQEVADLNPSARRALKPHLRCPHCEATAHFRSASRPSPGRRSKVAHFYALPHGDECDITRSYGDPWEDEDTDRTVAHWEQRNTTLIVRILTDQEEGLADNGSIGEPTESESRSRGGGDRTRSTNSVLRGPQKLLEQLVHWPSFKTSSLTLRMPDPNRTEMAVHDAFVRFEDATWSAIHSDGMGSGALCVLFASGHAAAAITRTLGLLIAISAFLFMRATFQIFYVAMALQPSESWLDTTCSFLISLDNQPHCDLQQTSYPRNILVLFLMIEATSVDQSPSATESHKRIA